MAISIHIRDELVGKRGPREFHSLEGYISSQEGDILIAHAGYNITHDASLPMGYMAYVNTLSSITGAIRGRVERVLGQSEQGLYRESIGIFERDTTLEIPTAAGAYLLRDIVRSRLPESTTHLRIIIDERARETLRDYYMRVGESLKKEGIIRDFGYYGDPGVIDGVCYQIRAG